MEVTTTIRMPPFHEAGAKATRHLHADAVPGPSNSQPSGDKWGSSKLPIERPISWQRYMLEFSSHGVATVVSTG